MTQRNRFIDIAKGFAIILVLFNHYFWQEGSAFNTHLYYWVICMAVPIFMLCTGYVTAQSFDSKKVTLKQSYTFEKLYPKYIRYIMPFLWFYIVETILTFVFRKVGYIEYLSVLNYDFSNMYNTKISFVSTLVFFFSGGRGLHGTYYFPIILQVALMIPVIYAIVKKHKWGIWLCFIINLLLEIFKNVVNLPYGAYRLLAFRYIFALSLGCYMYIYRDKKEKWYKWLMFFAVGAAYTYVVNYISYSRLIFTYWFRTSMISMLYITPMFLLGIRYMKNVRIALIENLGKASYHILMVQILYYNFLAPLVWHASRNKIINDFWGMAISLVICLGGGYAYYLLYTFISKKYKHHKCYKTGTLL